MNATRTARAALTQITEPGNTLTRTLITTLGPTTALAVIASGGEITDAERSEIESNLPRTSDEESDFDLDAGIRQLLERAGTDSLETLLEIGERHLSEVARLGGGLLIPENEGWPSQLNDLAVPPVGLWYRGDIGAGLPELGKAMAIVGSRDTTAYGSGLAEEFASDLAAHGVCVVSGGAYGIDADAHRGALDGSKSGMATIAVLASGVDRFYPAGNYELLETVTARGLLVSEVAPGVGPSRSRFLHRNRIIAALSGAVLVVEARWRSGAMNTAQHARDLGRAVGAVPGSVYSLNSAGCHRLLRDSGAVCVTDGREVLDLLKK